MSEISDVRFQMPEEYLARTFDQMPKYIDGFAQVLTECALTRKTKARVVVRDCPVFAKIILTNTVKRLGIRVLVWKNPITGDTVFELDMGASEWFEEFSNEYASAQEMLEGMDEEEERELFERLARDFYEGEEEEE